MKQLNEKLYINEDNIQGVQKIDDTYFLTTTNGNNIVISESLFNELKEYEGGGGSTGSSVVANPTLAGDEDALTGLEVDGTKYAVGGGKQLYLHNVLCADINGYYGGNLSDIRGNFSFICEEANFANADALVSYLRNKNGTVVCFGVLYHNSLVINPLFIRKIETGTNDNTIKFLTTAINASNYNDGILNNAVISGNYYHIESQPL